MTGLCSRCSSILSAAPHIFETTLSARHYSRRAEKFLAQHTRPYPVSNKKRQRSWNKPSLTAITKVLESNDSRKANKSTPFEQFWKSDWGEDKLRPPTGSSKKGFTRSIQPVPPILFSRRVEGLIENTEGPVLEDLVPPSVHNPIAKLSHNLDRVLFNPGTHWLRDPRSRVYNFTPWLESIPPVPEFAFERLQGFIKSSRDEDLRYLATAEKRPFAGSTSSLTGMLSQIYFLLSQDKPVNTDIFSAEFREMSTNFTPGQRMPASVVFNYKDGVYAIDSDSDASASEKNILTWLGTLLEKMLTTTPSEFMGYMRQSQPPIRVGLPKREAYRYAKSKRFVMRSQLDCHDSRLPGTGIFDIKTRACLPIRLDILNFEENSGYLIRSQHGLTESFEREYYDLIRSAFLKYSFQARIGNMDGVLVAYHNTARLFGFQYVPLEEMDRRLFGPTPGIGDRVFDKCLQVLEVVAEEITHCFPKQSVKCTFEAEEGSQVMNVWVEPVSNWTEGKIQQLQVKMANYFEKEHMHGHSAISENVNEAWTVRWSVVWLCNSPEELRKSLEGAKERQFRAYNYPTGIGPDEMPEFWKNLNFGSQVRRIQSFEAAALEHKSTWSNASFNPENFKQPSGHIKALRQASRNGKKIIEQMEEEDAGKTKIVLGSVDLLTYDHVSTNDFHDSPSEMTSSSEKVATASDVAAEDLPNLISEGMVPKTSRTASLQD